MKNNKDNYINQEIIEKNLFNFKDLFDGLKRRKKIFLFVSTFIFASSIINITYKRLVKPKYQGTFSIMIRDPILDKRRDSTGSGFIEDLAVNNTYSDIPTLIQYLKSEKVISNVAKSNNIPIN